MSIKDLFFHAGIINFFASCVIIYLISKRDDSFTMVIDVLLDTVLDSVKMLPFLFFAYILIEWLEHRASDKIVAKFRSSGKLGSFAGAVLGCVPQCGFSVASVKLYNAGVISVGALIAVLLSTSDEALPVLLANPDSLGTIWKLIVCKVVIAAAAGLIVDIVVSKKHGSAHMRNDAEEPKGGHHHHSDTCHCKCDGRILKPAVSHTAETFLFIFIVSLALNLAIALIGEERISAFLLTGTVFQPLIAGLVGFIPNCAASVILTELYVAGGISFGGALAGLCTGAGVGLAVLYKNRNVKNTLFICGVLYVAGVLSGLAANVIFPL